MSNKQRNQTDTPNRKLTSFAQKYELIDVLGYTSSWCDEGRDSHKHRTSPGAVASKGSMSMSGWRGERPEIGERERER